MASGALIGAAIGVVRVGRCCPAADRANPRPRLLHPHAEDVSRHAERDNLPSELPRTTHGEGERDLVLMTEKTEYTLSRAKSVRANLRPVLDREIKAKL